MTDTSSTRRVLIELDEVEVPRASAEGEMSIEGVSWKIRAGDYWAVSGLAGSGKSDLLNTAAGLMLPQRGSLRLFDRDVTQLDEDERVRERLRMGIVFAEGGRLFQELTLAQNIALPLRYHRNFEDADAAAQLAEVLALTKLEGLAGALPGSVGRMMWRRAALARALIMRPEVLFLDEPLRGLDRRESRWWIETLAELRRGHPLLGGQPVTLVVASEDLTLWLDHAETFALINERRWLFLGTQAEVRSRPERFLREWIAADSIKP